MMMMSTHEHFLMARIDKTKSYEMYQEIQVYLLKQGTSQSLNLFVVT
jgi:hypothetical protein